MTITAITGDIGSGKSFYQLAYGLWDCNRKRKRLVTNFALNMRELRRYAGMKRYGWIAHMIDTNQYAVVDCNDQADVLRILRIPSSVVLLDEAGIFFNTRNFANTPKTLLQDLFQSRKSGTDLYYAAQFDGQVDKQFRLLTQYFVYADGLSRYDPILGKPKLCWKTYYHFRARDYWAWDSDIQGRRNGLVTYFRYAFDAEFGWLSDADRQLFKAYDSFARLEKQSAAAKDIESSPLRHDFYQIEADRLRAAIHVERAKCSRLFGLVRWRSRLLAQLESRLNRVLQKISSDGPTVVPSPSSPVPSSQPEDCQCHLASSEGFEPQMMVP